MNFAEHTRASKRASSKVYIDNTVPVADGDTNTPTSPAPDPAVAATRKRVTLKLSHDISTEQLFTDQLIDGKVPDGEDDDDDDEDEDDDDHRDVTNGPVKERSRRSTASSSHHHSHSTSSSSGHKSKRSSHRKSSSSHSSSKSKNATLPHQAKDTTAATTTTEQQQQPVVYRIESHSHLSSLDAKHLDKQQQYNTPMDPPASPKPTTNNRLALAPIIQKSPLLLATTSAEPLHSTTSVCAKCASNKDMPPLHCAAYSGHVTCLSILLRDQPASFSPTKLTQEETSSSRSSPTRPYYLDKKRRTPLFYSCAANRIDCCALLLSHRVEWRDLADKQLDTPVHVCCFFGWHECLKHLLDAGADPHGRNAKGFKPSHIAKTSACLELLLSYGDDLQQGDKLGRTPLFVACARDRSICVEFLCSWNHQTRSYMIEQEDTRGDKPIHAAACNGSNASLGILLRFGADPLIQNANGMTPKDLAVANNHPKCVELLTKAEQDLANANAWFAPANAAGAGTGSGSSSGMDSTSTGSVAVTGEPAPRDDANGGWIECWDNTSGQPFYYHNLSGKCQWEVPDGVEPHLLQLMQASTSAGQQQQQQQGYDDEDNAEYVWVKKKRQTVCVATGKESEWTAVQDPTSKAIYYKNTKTGQSQWEEPDAVQQLQSASAALASQQASKVWDELEASRTALAKVLAADKYRQMMAQQAAIESFKLEIQRRRDDIRKKEEQAKLQLLLPRSSFIRRKKQSMMIKIKTSSSSQATSAAGEEDKMEQICQREPSLDIFLSTYLKLHGVQDLQLSLEKRFFNCLFHYYVALVDPIQWTGLSKSQFRTVLRDAAIIPSSFAAAASSSCNSNNNSSSYASLSGVGGGANTRTPTLKLHIVDLIFAQAIRVQAMENSTSRPLATGSSFHSASYASLVHSPHHRQAGASASAAQPTGTGNGTGNGSGESHLGVVGFVAAMQIVRERMVALAEDQPDPQQQPFEIDDDEEWFLTSFVLPLTVKLGGKMLTQIRECKELELDISASPKLQHLLSQNRHAIQRLHRHYTSSSYEQLPANTNTGSTKQQLPAPLKMLTFRGLGQFAQDFALVPTFFQLPTLHQLYEAVNWISGHAHTEIISFEKFQQILTILAAHSFGRTTTGTGLSPPAAVPATVPAAAPAPDRSNGVCPLSGEREAFLFQMLVTFFRHLEANPSVHRIADATRAATTDSSSPSADPAAVGPFFVLPPAI